MLNLLSGVHFLFIVKQGMSEVWTLLLLTSLRILIVTPNLRRRAVENPLGRCPDTPSSVAVCKILYFFQSFAEVRAHQRRSPRGFSRLLHDCSRLRRLDREHQGGGVGVDAESALHLLDGGAGWSASLAVLDRPGCGGRGRRLVMRKQRLGVPGEFWRG